MLDELCVSRFLETQGLKLLHFQKSAPAGSGAGSAGQPTIEGLFEIPELVMSAAVSALFIFPTCPLPAKQPPRSYLASSSLS